MSTELKPCPFCGVSVDRITAHDPAEMVYHPWNPGSGCPIQDRYFNLYGWNRRTLPDREALEGLLRDIDDDCGGAWEPGGHRNYAVDAIMALLEGKQ